MINALAPLKEGHRDSGGEEFSFHAVNAGSARKAISSDFRVAIVILSSFVYYRACKAGLFDFPSVRRYSDSTPATMVILGGFSRGHCSSGAKLGS